MNRFITILGFIIALSACKKAKDGQSGKLQIVTTTPIIADMVEEIVGDSADVKHVIPLGTDLHSYSSSPGDVALLENADIIVNNGLGLESKLQKTLHHFEHSDEVLVITLAEAVNEQVEHHHHEDEHDHHHHEADPHIWLSIDNWKKATLLVSNSLSVRFPKLDAHIKGRTTSYIHRLDSLENLIKQDFQSIEKNQRVLITNHNAFGYFGKSYGFKVEGVKGYSTLSETSVQHAESLAELIMERKIKAVFSEYGFPKKDLIALQRACEEEDYVLTIIEPLFTTFTDEDDNYINMMSHNSKIIVNGLR